MDITLKCQTNMCQNEATIELHVKTDGLIAFIRGDVSKNGKPYIVRTTRQCAEHAQEYRNKFLIESEIGL